MGFYELNEEQKVHLNLSRFAFSILENDRILFGAKNPASIINVLIKNFRDIADASIYSALERYKDDLQNALKDLENKDEAVSILVKRYEEALITKTNSYPKGIGFKFRINNENYGELTDVFCCHEDLYYQQNIGKYIKSLVEEYTRKSFIEREQIYFAEQISVLEYAIEKGYKTELKIGDNKYLVTPVKIAIDNMQSYNYLVAITDDDKIWSYRISRLESIKFFKSKIRKLSIAEKKNIDQMLEQKGIQFIGNKLTRIKVELTDEGIQKYKNMLFLRPDYVNIENGNVYCFDCTALQIEYYFFKFGSDAKIISPDWLSDQFSKKYDAASNRYRR